VTAQAPQATTSACAPQSSGSDGGHWLDPLRGTGPI